MNCLSKSSFVLPEPSLALLFHLRGLAAADPIFVRVLWHPVLGLLLLGLYLLLLYQLGLGQKALASHIIL